MAGDVINFPGKVRPAGASTPTILRPPVQYTYRFFSNKTDRYDLHFEHITESNIITDMKLVILQHLDGSSINVMLDNYSHYTIRKQE